jgi:hypothetical protein
MKKIFRLGLGGGLSSTAVAMAALNWLKDYQPQSEAEGLARLILMGLVALGLLGVVAMTSHSNPDRTDAKAPYKPKSTAGR